MDLSDKMVPKTEEEKKKLQNRLKRIEGQIRGIENMVAEDRYCIDILTQISSVVSALDGVSMMILERHAKTCMKKSYENGREEEAVDELMRVIKRMR